MDERTSELEWYTIALESQLVNAECVGLFWRIW